MGGDDLIGYLAQAYREDDLLWRALRKIPVNITLARGQLFFKESPSPAAMFVHQGLVKGFYYDIKGKEQVTRFWTKNQMILLSSAHQASVATADCLQGIEKARLSAINPYGAGQLRLSDSQTALLATKLLLFDRNMAELKALLCSFSAREAYMQFQRFFPHHSIPLRDIASFLGITPQTISEIRKSSR
ncbi:Crp/Fnr family transcriptional regulator [Dyadobacter sp. OTU695]|uniref:Crp/Fnr family transcriptional regulator n=1 Tax=Dyadobacter sp. OTU695 TaxID=3043860 RepID=UPI00313D3600